VDEFAYSYLTSIEVGGGRRVVYCEHGNQLDAANTVEDYSDRLDTPLGHHVVMDFTRRVAPYGEVSPGLDLSEIKMVYPLVAIPGWVAGRYFYDFVGKVASYRLLPLLVAYALYRVAAYLLFSGGLPRVHELFLDIGIFGLFTVALFAVFFLVVRHAVRRTVNAMSPGETRQKTPRPSPAEASRAKVREILAGEANPPMSPSLDPSTVDVFVSGHTHLPSLEEVERADGRRCVAVNSGCYLRQLQPVRPRLKGPRSSCRDSCSPTRGSTQKTRPCAWSCGSSPSPRGSAWAASNACSPTGAGHPSRQRTQSPACRPGLTCEGPKPRTSPSC